MHVQPTINNRIEPINRWTNKTDQQSTSKPVGLIVVWFRARHLNSQSNNNWQTVSPRSFIKIPTLSTSVCKNRRNYHRHIVHFEMKRPCFARHFKNEKKIEASFLYKIWKKIKETYRRRRIVSKRCLNRFFVYSITKYEGMRCSERRGNHMMTGQWCCHVKR